MTGDNAADVSSEQGWPLPGPPACPVLFLPSLLSSLSDLIISCPHWLWSLCSLLPECVQLNRGSRGRCWPWLEGSSRRGESASGAHHILLSSPCHLPALWAERRAVLWAVEIRNTGGGSYCFIGSVQFSRSVVSNSL